MLISVVYFSIFFQIYKGGLSKGGKSFLSLKVDLLCRFLRGSFVNNIVTGDKKTHYLVPLYNAYLR